CFFFQAEDGIRADLVTGVQTCALPISLALHARGHAVTLFERGRVPYATASSTDTSKTIRRLYGDNAVYVELAERAERAWHRWDRSEERRVGKEDRSRCARYGKKQCSGQ